MGTRDQLHRLIDQLSETEVEEALQYVSWQRADGFTRWLRSLPSNRDPDSIPETDTETHMGDVISFAEIRRRHGYE